MLVKKQNNEWTFFLWTPKNCVWSYDFGSFCGSQYGDRKSVFLEWKKYHTNLYRFNSNYKIVLCLYISLLYTIVIIQIYIINVGVHVSRLTQDSWYQPGSHTHFERAGGGQDFHLTLARQEVKIQYYKLLIAVPVF